MKQGVYQFTIKDKRLTHEGDKRISDILIDNNKVSKYTKHKWTKVKGETHKSIPREFEHSSLQTDEANR